MSKANSRVVVKTTKKNIERPGLSTDEVDEIRQAFELFDTNGTGRIDPKELKAAMQSLGFDSKNPTIFQLIAELDTPEVAKRGGHCPKKRNKNGCPSTKKHLCVLIKKINS